MGIDLPLASSFAADIDGVISLVNYMVTPWLIAAEVVLVYFVFRYLQRDDRRAAWLPGGTLKSHAWILIPAAIVTVCDLVIEHESTVVWNHVKRELPPHEVLVRVKARQFAWDFTYAGADGVLDTEDDVNSMTEMHVPVDAVVRFQLESEDVLHSFWVPALRLKQDIVPGRSIPGWFEATRAGEYEIACAEICGGSHTVMRGNLTVESREAFAAWLQARAEQQSL